MISSSPSLRIEEGGGEEEEGGKGEGEGEGEGEHFGGPDVAPCSLNDEPWKKIHCASHKFFLHFQFSLLATFAYKVCFEMVCTMQY